jgi:uroporphyrinogen-III decarboxylase
MEERYRQRLARYTAAMRNEKPDRIPIRPFVAEFCATYAGYTCQEVTHDYEKGFEAVRRCAADFDWDAVVPNMVYVWTGLTQAIGLNYYGIPGIHIPPDTGFQYREPSEQNAHMSREEYDALIDDPTGFLFNVWLPRVSDDVAAMGEKTSYRNNLSFLKGGMAMLTYFNAFGPQIEKLRVESGTVSAISGILKAPLDILGDKLRGYLGLAADLRECPDKVLRACEALAPHLLHVALSGADPDKNVPVSIWMHRGCVPFVSFDHFNHIYWPTLKPIIEEIWRAGHQTLFYAEGDWNRHLDKFAELPEGSIIYHCDRGDIFEAHQKIGHKFCLSGGIPNTLLSFGTAEEVRDRCKKVIDGVARDGGYILDASAIVQNDAKVENMKAMTDFVREYGIYDGPSRGGGEAREEQENRSFEEAPAGALKEMRIQPGVCIPWAQKSKETPEMTGDEAMVRRVWEEIDSFAYTYIWHCLVSF